MCIIHLAIKDVEKAKLNTLREQYQNKYRWVLVSVSSIGIGISIDKNGTHPQLRGSRDPAFPAAAAAAAVLILYRVFLTVSTKCLIQACNTPPTHLVTSARIPSFLFTQHRRQACQLFTHAHKHTQMHTHSNVFVGTLETRSARRAISLSVQSAHMQMHNKSVSPPKKKNACFTNADALIDSHCKHAHTPCDLVWACLACWQVGRTECVRSGAHTLSSRCLMFKLASYALGECAGESLKRNADEKNPLSLLNNTAAIKHALPHLVSDSIIRSRR